MSLTLLDGGFGTMLQAAGLPSGKDPADWNLENPAAVTAVHRAYVDAGTEVVCTNTFGVNRLKYHGNHALEDLIRAAVANARAAGPGRVALDVGPTGRLLAPAGDLAFEEAYAAFAETVRLGVAAGVDLVLVETMGDIRELKAAVLAAKDCGGGRPVWATVALGEDGKLLTGGDVDCVSATLEALGVDAYGFNCGLGPDRMLPHFRRLASVATKPLIVKPNAGMPRLVDGRTVFDVGPADFARHVAALVDAGAAIVGGCCGTTPEHIRALPRSRTAAAPTAAAEERVPTVRVASGTHVVTLRPHAGVVIGERINPTGKKRLKEAYQSGDTAYVMREAVAETDQGAAILDVNCGVPGLDESAVLDRTLACVESVADAPIQIDTADPKALEVALRHVNGKPLVNSVNGRRDSMDAVFPLVKRYGGAVVALCLDENGIPPTAEGRLAIARRILAEGARYGLTKADFVVDALTLAVSADPQAAVVTLETVRRLTEELGVNTVLGVSNVSFGLPNRPALNAAMYALAVEAGLSAAILNPSAPRAGDDARARDVLLGRDPGCARWIAANAAAASAPSCAGAQSHVPTDGDALRSAVVHGLKEDAGAAAKALLAGGVPPMEVVEKGIVPALEQVGAGFEKGTTYLPQLLMAADAAGAAFEAVRVALARTRCPGRGAGHGQDARATGGQDRAAGERPIVLATVKGDIHDIGKNIVRALLENYGFAVIDLGRDVAPERIVAAARENGAFLVGLSALMTTTVGAMAETIRALKAAKLDCRVCVGGAVVTQEYADEIGADFYAKDAMRTVRIAETLRASLRPS